MLTLINRGAPNESEYIADECKLLRVRVQATRNWRNARSRLSIKSDARSRLSNKSDASANSHPGKKGFAMTATAHVEATWDPASANSHPEKDLQ